ncbi:hypothetical protein BD309DRAFT_946355 [Dichomitus squalens]|nr:hypothetical protein BD309DRAFT_946355 [Dichomitus squalens]
MEMSSPDGDMSQRDIARALRQRMTTPPALSDDLAWNWQGGRCVFLYRLGPLSANRKSNAVSL